MADELSQFEEARLEKLHRAQKLMLEAQKLLDELDIGYAAARLSQAIAETGLEAPLPQGQNWVNATNDEAARNK